MHDSVKLKNAGIIYAAHNSNKSNCELPTNSYAQVTDD